MADDAIAGEGGGAPGSEGPEHYFALPAGTKIFEFEIDSVGIKDRTSGYRLLRIKRQM